MKDEDKYKDTLASFIDSTIKCSHENANAPTIENTFTKGLVLTDDTYETDTTLLVSTVEGNIKGVLKNDLPQCTKDLTDKLVENYHYSFKLLWLSKISGLNDCDDNCLVDDTDDTKFILRAMKDTIAVGVEEDLSCSGPNNQDCNDAVKDILNDKFISDDYKMQKNKIKTVVDGVMGNLNKAYQDWLQTPGMDECRKNMLKICSGKIL